METEIKCLSCGQEYPIDDAHIGQILKKRSRLSFLINLFISLFAAILLSACGKSGEDEFKAGMLSYKAEDYKPALKQFILAAEKGNADAEYMLGNCFFFGVGVTPDKTEAVDYFRKAAEQKNANAQYMLGLCCESGIGIDQNKAEADRLYQMAVKSFQKSAEKGDAEAQLFLGHCYEFGRGTEEDIVAAYKLYSKAADSGNVDAKKIMGAIKTGKTTLQNALQGDAKSQYMLGNSYQRGEGVPQDGSTAAKWYRKAADQGNHEAQYMLGNGYQRGEGVPKDDSTAAKWYRKAADQGNREAQYRLGGCYFEGRGVPQDYDEAAKWYQKAADQGNEYAGQYIDAAKTIKFAKQGDAYAQYKLGKLYLAGDIMAQDNNEALNWLRKSADQGNENAQFELGRLYCGKEDVLEKNMAKAIDWWLKAANQGHAKAQFNIGVCFYNGEGEEKDLSKAAKWFHKAAEQGDMDAQHILGNLYYFGNGVDEDIIESTKWYLKAAQQGKEESTDFLSSMGSDNELISDAVRGNADAQFMLAESLRRKLKWDQSKEDIRKNSLMFKWYKKAAEHGNWKAQYNLGVCYYKQYDRTFFSREEEISDESIEWFSKAAEQGHAKAQCILGYIYYYGRNSSYGTEIKANVEKDKSKALAWFQKAADQGDETAINNLRIIPNNGKIKKPNIEWNEQEEIGKNKNPNETEKTSQNPDHDPEENRKLISYICVDAISRTRFNGLEYTGVDGEKYYAAEFHEISKSIELFNANKKRIKAVFNVVNNNHKRLKYLEIGDMFKHNDVEFELIDIKLETTSDEDERSGFYYDENWKGKPVAYIQRVGKKERIACHPKQPVYDPATRVRLLNTKSDRTFVSSVCDTFKLGDAKSGEEQYKIVSADPATKEVVVESMDKDKVRYRLTGSSVQVGNPGNLLKRMP